MLTLALVAFYLIGVFGEGLLDFLEFKHQLSNRAANVVRIVLLIIIIILAKWLNLS